MKVGQRMGILIARLRTRKVRQVGCPDLAAEVAAPANEDSSFRERARWSSLFAYSPGLILISIAVADSIRVIDPDFWGHLRFGQAMLAKHRLILHDPYSYSVPGHLWTNYEWLGDILIAASYNHAGVLGLTLLKVACAALIVIFLTMALAETGAPMQVQFGVLIYSAVVVKPQLQFRPQSFTIVLLSVLIWMLARDAYRRAGRLWLTIPVLALWANLHGGFVMGIIALGIYSAIAILRDIVIGRGWGRGVELGGITIAATCATLSTPYGLAIWPAVVRSLRDPFTRAIITDWRPLAAVIVKEWRLLGPHVSNHEVALALMAATGVSWAFTFESDDLPMVAIAAFTAVCALVSQYHLPIAAIAIAPPLARHLHLAIARRWRIGERPAASPSLWWINQAVLASLSVFILVRGGFLARRIIATDPYPVAACEFMERRGLRGNILNEYDWGEYLIWRMAPGSKIFIDGRYDTVYPVPLIAEYLAFKFNLRGGDLVLNDFPTDYILIRSDSAARELLERRTDWKLIYRDGSALLYAPSGAPAALASDLPMRGTSSSAIAQSTDTPAMNSVQVAFFP
jgi:hypothetical protein